MRMTRWAQKFNLTVIPCEDRPDRPAGDHVHRIVDIFTTRDSSWEPSDIPGSIEPWARGLSAAVGRAGLLRRRRRDHHLFARALDAEGRPVTTERLVRYWSDGLAQLGNPSYQATARDAQGTFRLGEHPHLERQPLQPRGGRTRTVVLVPGGRERCRGRRRDAP